MKTPFFTSYWGGRSTEDAILTMAWSKASDGNESGMSVPQVEDLIVAARAEGDEGVQGAGGMGERGCRGVSVRAVFIEWWDYAGNYGFEQVDY
ncbi:hypothetical protein [Pseudogemmobacter humi]|uniref:Uncharacterized protein n=1 Tax=Pseudogemmobacter humi TaxID=2483812 RepID=A0A3P5WMS5_9RHOB|nr:hypothetical protein [Pseudogemmobacter humi]VDC19864.1 hypothetical protein XINFAN_00253 [Pseudogemmobacter humi]